MRTALAAPARWPRAALRTARRRWRRGGPSSVAWAVRLTGAAVASYVVALAVLPNPAPLLAPLTALLVVQLTPVSLLAAGLDRIAAVVAGVAVAVSFASVVELSWWSLGLVIGISMLVGQALRLGPNLPEVAISAMLVLGAGSLGTDTVAWQRATETLVGAAVGIAVTLALPPRIASADAGAALSELCDHLAELLGDSRDVLGAAPDDLGVPRTPIAVDGWLERARRASRELPRVDAAVRRAEEGRRLNLRALASIDTGPGLRQALVAVENTTVAVRSMYRSLLDGDARAMDGDQEVGALVRGAAALALGDMADAVGAFGDLVGVDARRRPSAAEVDALVAALEELRESRARLTELVLVDDAGCAELGSTLLSGAQRLLAELDLGRREEVLRARPARGLPAVVDRRLLAERPGEGTAAGRRLERAMLAVPPLRRARAVTRPDGGRAQPRHSSRR